MNILITGGTGYLGSHLARACLARGDQISLLKRGSSNLRRIKDVEADLAIYDLDQADLRRVLRERKIEAIIHAATCYGRQGENLDEMLRANLLFPAALLDAASSFGVTPFINTDTCLDAFLNNYALSKKQFAQWGKLYAGQGKIRFLNLVLEHFYGPGDDESKFVSFLIRQCLNDRPEIALTKGEQKRDFIYIDDVVSAYLLLLDEAANQSEPYSEYDLGSGEAVSIRSLVEMIHALTQSKSQLNFGAIPYRPGEAMYSCADIQPLRQRGWAPHVPLHAGLEKTLAEDKKR